MTKTKNSVNTVILSKKYKCDVKKLIRYWKNEKSDFEISQALGINMMKLLQIRQEIADFHEKERQQRLKRGLSQNHKFSFISDPR